MIVLDTHAWVWWVSQPDVLPAAARRLLDDAVSTGGTVALSSISAWEVAMLAARGRLELSIDVETWIAHAEALPFVHFVPVDNHIALRAVSLEHFPHRDPADRIIVATTQSLGATLLTADKRLQAYRAVATVWE